MSQAPSHSYGHAHHFPDAKTQYSASKFGMWLFLAQELVFFGVLFAAYAIFRSLYPEMFSQSHEQLNRIMGGINTVVLITSSFTMALAVDAAKNGQIKKLRRNLIFTIAFAFVFAIIKYFEYRAKFEHGIYPDTNIFFGLYFSLTGLHMLHVFVGIGLLAWIWVLAGKGRFTKEYNVPVENVGLYWHLVDLIWIYLFPLLYLIS